ncbi:hypothetical protein H0H87_005390 [Tephrocybe sp. NHM501043]|nr:hypothetical protein H0H87_005390 [Tephrocybe sp. NHM501043]
MFVTFALTAFLASTSLLVRADAVPSQPGPGIVYKVGGTCHIEWNGDADSTTAWKNMAIELMTGENLGMVHLTTVATGLDGTVSGSFDHICPSVTPNAPIYFYQFSAPGAVNKQWTTRFTIASTTGATTPATNPTQPKTGAPIPWGTGALTDPSTAVAAPSFAESAAPSANDTTSVSATATPIVSSSPDGVPTAQVTSSPTTSRLTTIITSSTGTPSPSPSTNSTSGNSTQDNAAASFGVDSRVWQAAVALGASTMAFTLLL